MEIEDRALYLGLDCSTQSLTLQALEVVRDRRRVVWEHAVQFDRDCPGYGTTHGVLPSQDPLAAEAPPLVWADALDRAFASLAASDLDRARIVAIAGSAQQHGSVYLNAEFELRLQQLDSSRDIAAQLSGVFARPVAPIWMDRTTTVECREITAAMGGPAELARLTGSRAFERFTGPQIRRFAHRDPDGYARTVRVHLVSSFMASLLAGRHAPLDPGDASGMNLMDLSRVEWSPAALDATAPQLHFKLPGIVRSDSVIGVLSRYWQERYTLPAAKIVAWTGDNPSSLIGTGLVTTGRIAISLGTSDTVFGLMPSAVPSNEGIGHIFGAPTDGVMGLTCFQNGSLARERMRDAFGLDWDGFSAALRRTPAGNTGALMLPWFEGEITPDVTVAGVHRLGLSADDAARNVRAVVEAQMMSMANHSIWMGVDVDVIHATGGAAINRDVLQVMADVFGADVYRFAVSNSACLGAALRAWHAHARESGREIPWTEIVRDVAEPIAASKIAPISAHVAVYADARRRYADFESRYRTPSSSSTTS